MHIKTIESGSVQGAFLNFDSGSISLISKHSRLCVPYVVCYGPENRSPEIAVVADNRHGYLVQFPGDNFPMTARQYPLAEVAEAAARIMPHAKAPKCPCCHHHLSDS